MTDVEKVAEDATLIVAGYAFSPCNSGYRILNLNRPEKAVVLSENGEMLESTMDDIEVRIVQDYFEQSRELID